MLCGKHVWYTSIRYMKTKCKLMYSVLALLLLDKENAEVVKLITLSNG